MRTSLLLATSLLCSACASSSAPSTVKTYTGPYSVQVVESTVTTSLQGGGTFSCTNTYLMSGTLTLKVDRSTGGESTATIDGTQKEIAHAGGDSCKAKATLATKWAPALTVTVNDVGFETERFDDSAGYGVTSRVAFAGLISGGAVTGVLGFSVAGAGVIGGTSEVTQNFAITTSVTLR